MGKAAAGDGTEQARGGQSRFRQWLDRLRPAIARRFTVDARALAAVRILLALTIIGDLLHRAQYLEFFYTDAGVHPVAAYEVTYLKYDGLSLHALSGDLWYQALLFLLAGLVALAMLVGYRTRLATAISFLLLFSLHARNPALLNGGDRLFRVMVFLGILVPLGERWSVDALRRGTARDRVRSLGTVALLLQPLAVFSANALLKHRGDHWYGGDALQIAMANDVMTVFIGNYISAFPRLLTVLNYGWVVLLAGSPLLLWLSVGRLRAAAAVAYASAFAGMALTMAVGVFPFALIAAVLPYLTTPFWDALGRRVPDRYAALAPTAAQLGPLRARPLERRLLSRARDRGYGSQVDFGRSYARSLVTMLSLLAIVWILVFTASDVYWGDPPAEINNDHLDVQRWGLYAPDPASSYTWYAIEADLANGTSVDAETGGEVDLDRPPDAAKTYDSFRHRKYMQVVRDSGQGDRHPVYVQRYADWACEEAASRHDQPVDRVRIHRIVQPSPVDGEYDEPWKLVLYEYDCEDDWRDSL